MVKGWMAVLAREGSVRPVRRGGWGRWLLVATGALSLAGCDSLSTMMGSKPSAEQTCSSQETYDALTGILAAQAGSATSLLGSGNQFAAAASPGAFKNVLSYSAPTVEDINKNTGKITCKALLKISTSTALLSDQQGLQPNDFGPDHVTYAIGYSVQTTADRGQPLTTLDNAGALSAVAFQASVLALKRGGDAAAATGSDMEDDRAAEEPEPTAEEGQAAADRANMLDEQYRAQTNGNDGGGDGDEAAGNLE